MGLVQFWAFGNRSALFHELLINIIKFITPAANFDERIAVSVAVAFFSSACFPRGRGVEHYFTGGASRAFGTHKLHSIFVFDHVRYRIDSVSVRIRFAATLQSMPIVCWTVRALYTFQEPSLIFISCCFCCFFFFSLLLFLHILFFSWQQAIDAYLHSH